FCTCPASHPTLPSSPTRRSSDLLGQLGAAPGQPVGGPHMARDALLPGQALVADVAHEHVPEPVLGLVGHGRVGLLADEIALHQGDRKSTRLNSSHVEISYAVFCL